MSCMPAMLIFSLWVNPLRCDSLHVLITVVQNCHFTKTFTMLGSSQIRGFESGSLGAKEVCRTVAADDTVTYARCPSARSLGGNVRLFTRADLYLPFLGTRDSDDKRFSIFLDAGNTFMASSSDYAKRINSLDDVPNLERVSLDNFRAASGLAFEWLSPLGPFGISYGFPIQKKEGDKTNKFQITLGYLN